MNKSNSGNIYATLNLITWFNLFKRYVYKKYQNNVDSGSIVLLCFLSVDRDRLIRFFLSNMCLDIISKIQLSAETFSFSDLVNFL